MLATHFIQVVQQSSDCIGVLHKDAFGNFEYQVFGSGGILQCRGDVSYDALLFELLARQIDGYATGRKPAAACLIL